jgi:hypothetical protein
MHIHLQEWNIQCLLMECFANFFIYSEENARHCAENLRRETKTTQLVFTGFY